MPAGQQQAGTIRFALECKAPWCELILSGKKSVEVRRYPPPKELAGQKCWLLASGGAEGVATFGDSIAAGAEGGSLVGWVLFDSAAVEYSSPQQFDADATAHCVPPGSPYATFEELGGLWGWRVVASHRLVQALPLPAMQRVVRSLYRVE